MLTITPEARHWITRRMDEANLPESAALRVFDRGGLLHMGVDEPRETDKTYKNNNKVILAVSEDAIDKLKNRSLRCQETEQGEALTFAAAPALEG